jgi:hypothetical protein
MSLSFEDLGRCAVCGRDVARVDSRVEHIVGLFEMGEPAWDHAPTLE